MKRKTLIAGLLISGVSLVITAISAFIWRDLLEQPAGLLGLFVAVFLAVAGLFGGTVREWADNIFGLKDKGAEIKRQINFVQNIFEADSNQDQVATVLFTIPLPVQDFTGREKELEQLRAEFERGVLITGISGGGGIGKTELARKLADQMKDNYPAARMSIDLLGISETPMSAEEAMRRMLEPFYPNQKLPDNPDQLKGLYQQTFATQRSLLLLDNAATASQVRPLIPPPPSTAIVTSRQHFSLSEFGLKEPLRLDVLSPESAREMLRVASDRLHGLGDQELDELAKLCGHLPLALRVAASLLNDRIDLTLATLLNRLADEHMRLERLKRDNDHDLEIEASLSLSYDLLTPELQKCFRYLALFRAPFVENSAAEVWGMADPDEAHDILGRLVNRSLLTSTFPSPFQQVAGKALAYYSLHDLTRLYAVNLLLRSADEAAEALSRYASHYLRWGNMVDGKFQEGGEKVLISLAHFRAIWPHLFNAWEHLAPNQPYWIRPAMADDWLSGFPTKCIHVLDLTLPSSSKIPIFLSALDASRRMNDRTMEGRNLGNLGNAYYRIGDIRKAIESYKDSLIAAREVKNPNDEAAAVGNLGNSYFALGELEKAKQFYEQALKMGRETSDRKGEGAALHNLGVVFGGLGDTNKAMNLFEEALSIAQEIGDHQAESMALSSVGSTLVALDRSEEAIKILQQALKITHIIGDQYGEEGILGDLGNAHSALGEKSIAIKYYQQALSLAMRLGSLNGQGLAHNALGIAYADLGERNKSIWHYEQAVSILESTGSPLVQSVRKNLSALRGEFPEHFYQMSETQLNEFIQTAIQASRKHGLEARKYFEAISKTIRDPKNPSEIQAVLRVLQNILIGNKNPDLSELPERLAKLIKEELEK